MDAHLVPRKWNPRSKWIHMHTRVWRLLLIHSTNHYPVGGIRPIPEERWPLLVPSVTRPEMPGTFGRIWLAIDCIHPKDVLQLST